MKPYLTLTLLLVLTLVGCVSYQQHAAERTAQLREMYPPGISKEAVQAQWGQVTPDFTASRPSSGWDAHANRYIAEKLGDMESRMGTRIESVDRYWGSDGFLSLCYCWYFYDSRGRLVDVEWQYKSD
jgi:hypothetical protein